jgi:hypothetical protein
MKRYKAVLSGVAIAATLGVTVAGATLRPVPADSGRRGSADFFRWGYRGHEITGRAAATNLPAEFPAFFRAATEQLTYLNPEPDRWRAPDSVSREMNQAFSYDHYIDLEAVPANALNAHDRWEYWARAHAAGAKKVGDVGFLPYRTLEMYQRLEHEFQLWRNEKDQDRRRFIEMRIINDAGILGHYVADAANPHHTTVHHDRWAEGYPNPKNFTTERGFHSRFESTYVETHITDGDVIPLVRAPQRIADVRAGVMQHILRSHALLDELYTLDKAEAFGPATRSPSHKAFAVGRLVAGADMLRDLWLTAWLTSGEPGAH